jgi:hypothetical protein
MGEDVLIAALSLIGTIAGSITGILVSNRLSNYRIGQLETKLDRYAANTDEIRERLIIVEQSAKSAHHRLDDITQQLKITEHRKDR